MKFVILDLEWNSALPGGKTAKRGNKVLPCEIIEIGAVIIDENLQFGTKFYQLVKAVAYRRINPFVRKLTKLETGNLKSGQGFAVAYAEFIKWLGLDFENSVNNKYGQQDGINTDEVVLCTWGNCDLKHLAENCKYHKITSYLPIPTLDVQYLYGRIIEQKAVQRKLSDAIFKLGIPFNGEWHRAVDDAMACGMVLQKLLGMGLEKRDLERFFIQKPGQKDKQSNRLRASSWGELYERLYKYSFSCPLCGTKIAIPIQEYQGGGDFKAAGECLEHGIIEVRIHLLAGKRKYYYAEIKTKRSVPNREFIPDLEDFIQS